MIRNSGRNNTVAAFIVAFFYLLCYASAYEYVSCPQAAQVQNAYWNYPDACAGGIYSHGSLNLKWADAPFTNDTVEVRSVSLMLRTRSPGTYMTIMAWNGRAWSFISGGRIDFLGHYVYDLTNVPGPYTDGSHRIMILNDGPGELTIEQLQLEIEYESKLKDLTVLVRDCDSNKRLEDVEVEVDGETLETDEDGEARFTLPRDTFYEIEVGGEDYHEKIAGVYLEDDAEVEVCVYRHERPAVEVRDLEVDDNVIEFYLENTGNVEDVIQYSVKVNDEIIFTGYATLEEGEEERVRGTYDFEPGRHKVVARAEVGGYADSDWTTYFVEGETENYRCSGKNVVREIILPGGISSWETVETCDELCSEGVCVAYYDYYEERDGSCGIEITAMDYADNIVASEIETFGVRVENKGESSRTVELKLYVDGQLKSEKGLRIGAGRSASAYFSFRLAAGSRLVRIDAVSCGYVSDSVSVIINVKSRTVITTPAWEPGEVPVSPSLPSGTETGIEGFSIQVSPGELSAAPCKGSAFRVTVSSPAEREYNVLVTGIEADLLDYPDTVTVEGTRDFYVFIKAPKEEGEYPIKVKVWLDSAIAESEVKLVVDKDALAGGQGEGADALTGFAVYAQSDWVVYAALISLIVTMAFIVVLRMFFTREQEYDFASLEYDQNVRRASVE